MIGTTRRASIESGRSGSRRAAAALALAAVLALALIAPAAANASPEGPSSLTATGTVVSVKASERTVTVKLTEGGEGRFVWSSDTRITGVLTPGARVTIRYTAGDGGNNQALQITVARN